MRRVLLLALVTSCAALAPAARGAGPGRPSSPEVEPADRARALATEAAAMLKAGKAAQAEAALLEASELDPGSSNLVYDLATARARLGKHADAVNDLERAGRLGFTDFPRIAREPAFVPLRESPAFRRFLDSKDRYLRRTAEGTLAALRNRFGDDGYQYEIDGERRLVFAVAGDAQAFDVLRVSLALEAEALGAALFEHGLDAYVTVLLPTPADYGKLVRFRNVPGLYVDGTKSLVARERGYVVPHEFAHALHAADQAAVGQRHATWVSEGLGALCESADFAGGRFTPRDNPRFASLVVAAKRKALIPLDRLVSMPQHEFVKRPNLTYGQSGYLMLYLWERKLLKPFYDAYKQGYSEDATGRRAIEDVTGKSLADVQEDWRSWLAARNSPATRKSP